ncbi:hypothetical protein LOD99_11927 [Oopsacas minuta]|uniref:Uncharacterized protein n=1 Tax=Oopsacas minuta TaxID=111878 RepID=A0AAV7JGX3_9METZ|nr:hypothetical protein LOD99_11927 [Oopsacas minuta]
MTQLLSGTLNPLRCSTLLVPLPLPLPLPLLVSQDSSHLNKVIPLLRDMLTVDTNSPTNPLIQPKLFPRTNFLESHQPEAELIQQHHEVPYTRSQPRDIMKGDKFEVKLVWQKQQPTWRQI